MIGIDIGTTQSKIAYVTPTGKPAIILNDRGEAHTPSVVHVGKNGNNLVGRDAVEQGYIEPERTAKSFKLMLGTRAPVLACGHTFDATDATFAMIEYLLGCAEQSTGKAIAECVATCPANFRDDAKQAMLEAFERHCVRVLSLLPEPTAAGFAYALHTERSKMKYLVYDFGGGTFDVSVLAIDGPQVTVLATEGVQKLGGNDLNDPIRERLLSEIKRRYRDEPVQENEPLLFQEIDTKAEAAKISLGNRDHVPCVVGYKGGQIIVELKQDEFNRSIDPLVKQSLEATDRAVQAAGLTYPEVDRLLLVGGSSRLPYIRDAVAKHTGLQPKTDIDPEKAIAYGASLACVSEMGKEGRTATFRGQVIPDPAMFIRDVTAHTVGCCVVDTTDGRKRLVNAELIPQNTTIPCKKVEHYYLEHEDQVGARIEILQGQADAERDDCLIIGELVLDSLPKEAKRTQRLQVECLIDANGMVTATATDKVSGKSTTVSVDYKKGIKPKDKPSAA